VGAAGNATATYLAVLPAGDHPSVRWVEVESLLGAAGQRVQVHGISLIGPPGRAWTVTLAGDGALRLVHRSDVKLYRHERALPRAYLVGQVEVAERPADALAALRRPSYDPERWAVLERDPGPSPTPESWRGRLRSWAAAIKEWLGLLLDPRAGTVTPDLLAALALDRSPAGAAPAPPGLASIVADRPEYVAVQVDTVQPALLVLRDTYYPGWTATVDGQSAPLLRADYLFRAVPVPAGSHLVEFRYRSDALERGGLLSILSLAVTGLLLMARSFPSAPGAPAGSERSR
jgi:hypothetical protein